MEIQIYVKTGLDKILWKNNFEIREKYFRINSKSVDRSTPDSDFLELPKSGENYIVVI